MLQGDNSNARSSFICQEQTRLTVGIFDELIQLKEHDNMCVFLSTGNCTYQKYCHYHSTTIQHSAQLLTTLVQLDLQPCYDRLMT